VTPQEKQAIKAIQEQILAISAENLAMQFVLARLLKRISETSPSLKGPILQAFDDAANAAENISIVGGAKSGHLPQTLRIIEQMRLMLVGEDKPKRDI
jgi:hypothetical protein